MKTVSAKELRENLIAWALFDKTTMKSNDCMKIAITIDSLDYPRTASFYREIANAFQKLHDDMMLDTIKD